MAPLRDVIWSCILLFSSSAWGIWNPIIPGWNPDPAILAVGGDYYVATSSFEYWPGIPIYHSKDLSNWTLFSHALTRPEQLQLFGTPTAAGKYKTLQPIRQMMLMLLKGGWAPSLAYINGKYWLSTMTRWTYDPVSRVWPRVLFFSSDDLITWSDPIWAEPWGIDPELFQDPKTKKTYLNLMAPNNNIDRVWGISQCEVSLSSGQCTGPYVSLWNGTLPHNSTARPEGPKMYYKDSWYYLLIAEGGTDNLHRSTIARSRSPSGPFSANPANPLMYNGQWGFNNLTVQSTGHATMMKTANGDWYASFIARRNVNEKAPLGRETFLTNVKWRDGWPVFNNGNPILLSEEVEPKSGPKKVPKKWVEKFKGSNWDDAWYQLRTPYTKNYDTIQKGLVLRPNVFGLSDRDTPAALLRKQTSLNMTFSAEVLGFSGSLGPKNKFGISAYLSEWQHQDIGIRGCVNQTGMCIYTESFKNKTTTYWQTPLRQSDFPRRTLTLHVRCTPLSYQLGYSFGKDAPTYPTNISSFWQAFGPEGYGVFSGASLALFGTGDGEPWPYNAPTVGFSKVTETYFQEDIPDYDRW